MANQTVLVDHSKTHYIPAKLDLASGNVYYVDPNSGDWGSLSYCQNSFVSFSSIQHAREFRQYSTDQVEEVGLVITFCRIR